MTIKASSLGGGGLPRLAPDLTYPTDKVVGGATYRRISAIDASAGLTTILSLTGKWAVLYMSFSSIIAEANTMKLTVDGVVVWNGSYTPGTTDYIFGARPSAAATVQDLLIQCETSFLLEYQTATDTNITFDYLARPIL